VIFNWENFFKHQRQFIFGDHLLNCHDVYDCLIIHGFDEEKIDADHSWGLKG